MAQVLRRRRLTATLIALPCILSILTLVSVWIFPSSRFSEVLSSFIEDNGPSNRLVSNPKISHPNSNSVKMKKSNNGEISTGHSTDTALVITTTTTKPNASTDQWTMVPKELLDLGVYDEASNFMNEKGIKPTGWEHPNGDPNVWGPCRFVPRPSESVTSLKWTNRRRQPPISSSNNNNSSASNVIMSPEYYRNADIVDFEYLKNNYSFLSVKNGNTKSNTVEGWCRPGFLIIGGGKCGTSSLYHYLIGHPRVLPAVEKQIHYFKYHDRSRPLEWYYGHFPTPRSFLEHGGLVTGEASPGYLPYPAVARDAYKAWKGDLSTNGAGIASVGKPLSQFLANPSYKSMVPEVPPRIIAIGREPFDRIYSSYKYNYVVPTMEYLRTNGHPRIPAAKKNSWSKKNNKNEEGFQLHREDDEYYMPYLFTLEEFVRAELKQLRGCLYDWGPGKTYNKWHRDATYKEAMKLRNEKKETTSNNNNDNFLSLPLIDLDGICYGDSVNKTVYREQWSEMQTKNPRKVLLNKNLFLTQALIGRSLYVFPLEWWYLNFRPDPDDASTINSITFLCTEDINKVETLNDLAAKLGLPKHDGFDAILEEGAYNVGGHRGYDKVTSWEELELERATNGTTTTANKEASEGKVASTEDSSNQTMTHGIPLPEDLYLELKEFIYPINERLFALTGKRCDW